MSTPDRLIGKFKKNLREEIQVRIVIARGVRFVDIRTFYPRPSGEMQPGKGIRMKLSLLRNLIKVLEHACSNTECPPEEVLSIPAILGATPDEGGESDGEDSTGSGD